MKNNKLLLLVGFVVFGFQLCEAGPGSSDDEQVESSEIITRSRSNAMLSISLEEESLSNVQGDDSSMGKTVPYTGFIGTTPSFTEGRVADAKDGGFSEQLAENSGGVWYNSKSRMPWNKGKMKQRKVDLRSQVEEAVVLQQPELLADLLQRTDFPKIDDDLLDTAYFVSNQDIVVQLLTAKTQQVAQEQRISPLPSPTMMSRLRTSSVSPLCYTSKYSPDTVALDESKRQKPKKTAE